MTASERHAINPLSSVQCHQPEIIKHKLHAHRTKVWRATQNVNTLLRIRVSRRLKCIPYSGAITEAHQIDLAIQQDALIVGCARLAGRQRVPQVRDDLQAQRRSSTNRSILTDSLPVPNLTSEDRHQLQYNCRDTLWKNETCRRMCGGQPLHDGTVDAALRVCRLMALRRVCPWRVQWRPQSHVFIR